MRKLVYPAIIGLALYVTGCGVIVNADDDDDDNGTSPCLGLVNGKSTDKFKSVVMLLSTESLCTGTFISHNLLFTASHCMDSTTTGGKRFVDGASFATTDLADAYADGIEPLRYYSVGPKSGDPSEATPGEQDLALVIFPDNTAPATSPIRLASPAEGEEVTLVGYGITKVTSDASGDGCSTFKKRTGTNELILSTTVDGLYYQGRADTNVDSGKTSDAVNASGDSGGPVFIDGKLAGVVSAAGRGGSSSQLGSSMAQSYAVDLKVEESMEFIQEVLDQEPDLEIEYE